MSGLKPAKADIGALARVNGMGEAILGGSYIKIAVRNGNERDSELSHYLISIGAADNLQAEIIGLLPAGMLTNAQWDVVWGNILRDGDLSSIRAKLSVHELRMLFKAFEGALK